MDVQMPSGLVIPSSLKYSLYRMIQDASISTNVLRLIPLNVQTVQGGGLISVRLPLATCSLPSFSMSFNNTISTFPTFGPEATTYLASRPGVAFPEGLESLIQRLEIVVAGVSLMTLPNYNILYQVLKDINQTLDHKASRNIVEGENDIDPNFNTSDGTDLNQRVLTVNNWYITSAATTGFTVHCTSSEQPPSNLGDVLYCYNAPPSKFFGYTSATALDNRPTIGNVYANETYVDGYSVGTEYTFILYYTLETGGTWTGGTSLATGAAITAGKTYSIPFSLACTTGNSTNLASGVHVDQTQSNTIRDFLGFFKAMPKAIQLAALGEVEVRLYLEQPQNVLVVPSPDMSLDAYSSTTPVLQTSAGQYQLGNIEFQIRTMSWDNGWLDSMMQSQLAEGNTLEIPYPNYYSVVQGAQPEGQSTTRFSVNTQNLRQVWSINRPNFKVNPQQLYIPSGVGIKQAGYVGLRKKGSFFCTTASNPSCWTDLPYTTAAPWNSTTNNPASNRWQYLINNQLIPNLQVLPQRTYAFTQELLGKEDWEEGTALANQFQYMSSSFAMGITLEYIDKYCDASVRELFGLDTRSASSVFYLNQTNNNAGDTTYVFSLFTSVLRVAMNNQIQVII